MDVIESHGKPMTFADIRIKAKQDMGAEWYVTHPSFERSLRRALHTLVCNEILIALGKGRPGNPFRYFHHPFLIGMIGENTPRGRALHLALDAAIPRRAQAGAPSTLADRPG
jgi:hypothetical protein